MATVPDDIQRLRDEYRALSQSDENRRRLSLWEPEVVARDVVSTGRVEILDVSGWTDFGQVLASIDARHLRIERRFKPVEDLQAAPPERMEARVRETVDLACGHDVGALCLRTSGIQPWQDPQADIEQVRRWIVTARRVADETLRAHGIDAPASQARAH